MTVNGHVSRNGHLSGCIFHKMASCVEMLIQHILIAKVFAKLFRKLMFCGVLFGYYNEMILNVYCFKWSLCGQETSIHTRIIMFTFTSHLGMAKNRAKGHMAESKTCALCELIFSNIIS